jgi:hypothetical protein
VRAAGTSSSSACLVADGHGLVVLRCRDEHAAGEDQRDEDERAALEPPIEVGFLVQLHHGTAPCGSADERVPRRWWALGPPLGDVLTHDRVVGGPDALDLVGEARQRLHGDGREEVRHGASEGERRVERSELDPANGAAGAGDPFGVLGERLWLVQHEQAGDELPQRAHGQPRAREILVGELDADHVDRNVAAAAWPGERFAGDRIGRVA